MNELCDKCGKVTEYRYCICTKEEYGLWLKRKGCKVEDNVCVREIVISVRSIGDIR